MSNLILAAGIIALLAYGYWLMERLDRFISHGNRRQASALKPWKALPIGTGVGPWAFPKGKRPALKGQALLFTIGKPQ